MRLIEFIFLAGQLYSSGALFLRNEAPRPCITNEGEIGECVLHDQCDKNSAIIEDGTGILNPRSFQSTDCPLSTVCCKILDKYQKDSDNSGELHRNQPINSREPQRNQPINSREPQWNQPIHSREPQWNQPINYREPHRNQPINYREPQRNQPINSREPQRNQVINSRESQWHQPINYGEPHRNQLINSREPHRNQPINSREPQRNQPINYGEPHRNQPINYREPQRNQPINSREPQRNQVINSRESQWHQPINYGEPHRNQLINSREPHRNQPIHSREPQWNQPINYREPHRNQPINYREPQRNQPINSREPQRNQVINSRESQWHQPINYGEPHRNQLINSREPHRNQPINSREPQRNQPINYGESHRNQPINSREPQRNQPINSREPQWNQPINYGEPHKNQPINSREPQWNHPINSREPQWNQQINYGEPHRNQPINSGEPRRNQPIASRPETTNHPQTSYSEELDRRQPKTWPCTTIDGSPGECVQNYLCDKKTKSVNNNGDGIIDVRIDESTDCLLPTVCCKISDNRQKDSYPQTPNFVENYQNQPKPSSDQETMNHPQTWALNTRNHPQTLAQERRNHPQTSAQESRNHPQTLVQETRNYPQTSAQETRNHPQTSAQESRNHPQTSAQETRNYPQTLSCTMMDGLPGECVQNYQCNIDTNSDNTYGDGIIDVRINESTDCPVPKVCCKIPDNRQKDSDPQTPNSEEDYQNQPKTSHQETTNHPQTLAQKPTNHPQTLSCTTMDGLPGECVQNYLCDMKTNSVIINGDNIIDVRIDESTDCPVPTVCCKIPDNRQKDSDPQTPNSEKNYQNQPKTSDQETITHPQTLALETINYPQTLALETINHPQTLALETINHPQTLALETINHPQTLALETINHPQTFALERINHLQTFALERINHPKTLALERINHLQTLTLATMYYPRTFSCATMDGSPGECVQNHLCDNKEKKNSTSTSGCPIRMVCCKVPDMSSRSNLPSQSALYPYIRVPRDMNRSGCGHRNPDGVNVTGAAIDMAPEYAKPGEFPWTVAVVNLKGRRVNRTAQFDYLGSGALIHERAVLTAAHIFHGASTRSTFYVVIGDYNQKAVNILPRKAIAVQNVEIHNLFDKNLYYDIALVFLQKPVLVSGHVNYICLPPPDYQDPVGTRCISSGWGKNGFDEHQHIMNKAELPVVEHTACQSLLRRVDDLGPVFELHSSFMCAGEGGVDSCKGSGGAPLACPMQNEPDRYVLSGIVSWSNNCSLDGIPSVYARVPTVRQWIDDKMAANRYSITST